MEHPSVYRLEQVFIIRRLGDAVPLLHPADATVDPLLHGPAGSHLPALRHRDVLDLTAGQEGGQRRREAEHPQAVQDGCADRNPVEDFFHGIPFSGIPQSESQLANHCTDLVDRLVGIVDPVLSGVLMLAVGLSLLSVMLPLIGMMNSMG